MKGTLTFSFLSNMEHRSKQEKKNRKMNGNKTCRKQKLALLESV